MDSSVIVVLMNDHCRVLGVTYEEGGKTRYVKTMDPTIDVDDLVVVEASTRHKRTVCKVVETDIEINFDTETGLRWVVQKIDEKGFETLLEKEAEAVDKVQAAERRRKRKELQGSLMKDHEEQLAGLEMVDIEQPKQIK